MGLIKYLASIGITTDENDQMVHSFIVANEAEIKESILQKWDAFKAANQQCEAQDQEAGMTDTENTSSLPETEDNDVTGTSGESESIINTENLPAEILPQEIKLDNMTDNDNAAEKAQNNAFEIQLRNKQITLPNGKAGQPYSCLFDIAKLGLEDIEDYWFEDMDKTGLEFLAETNEFKGVPETAGDYKIKLKCKRKGWTEGKPVFEREITLIINPDPRSLWNNIPTPTEIEYYKPDCDAGFVMAPASGMFIKDPRKDIVVASQRGRSHAHEGKPRDDDFGMVYDEQSEWYIIAVADGAGSAIFSRKGSEIACKTVVEICHTQLSAQYKDFDRLIKEFSKERSDDKRKKTGDALYNIIGSAVFKAYKNIEKEATEKNAPVKNYSTTLLVAICKKFKFGWFVGTFWVGDGGIGIYGKDTRFLKVMGEPDGGEFAGQTRFLTMPEIVQPAELYRRLRFEIVDDFTALILMTDGITDPKFETDANLQRIEKWDALWEDLSKEVEFTDNNVETKEQLLKWLDFWSQGNHDDRTIAILF